MNLDTDVGKLDLHAGALANVNDVSKMHVKQLIREKDSKIHFDDHVKTKDKMGVMFNAAKGTHQAFEDSGGLDNISEDDFRKIAGGQLQNAGDTAKILFDGGVKLAKGIFKLI